MSAKEVTAANVIKAIAASGALFFNEQLELVQPTAGQWFIEWHMLQTECGRVSFTAGNLVEYLFTLDAPHNGNFAKRHIVLAEPMGSIGGDAEGLFLIRSQAPLRRRRPC